MGLGSRVKVRVRVRVRVPAAEDLEDHAGDHHEGVTPGDG